MKNKTLTFTYNELYALIQSFRSLSKFPGEKFSYFVSKNISIINSKLKEVDAYFKEIKPEETPRIKEFSTKETELFESFAIKDPSGKPKMIEGYRYDIPEDQKPELDAKKKELYADYKDVIDLFEASDKKMVEFKEKPVEVSFYTVLRSTLPAMITAENRFNIEELIIDDIDCELPTESEPTNPNGAKMNVVK